MIEVEYLSEASIKDHIKELVWSFRRMILPNVAANLVSPADYMTYRRESEQAWSSLSTAFSHQKEFSREFLLNESEEAFEHITNRLCEWTATIPWPRGGRNGKWVASAKTTDECYEATRPFTRQNLWPFTKIIR
jgi:hypothetical protein